VGQRRWTTAGVLIRKFTHVTQWLYVTQTKLALRMTQTHEDGQGSIIFAQCLYYYGTVSLSPNPQTLDIT